MKLLSDSSPVTRCHNLRPVSASADSSLEAAPLPQRLSSDGWKLIAEVISSAGKPVEIFCRDLTVAILSNALPIAEVTLSSPCRYAYSPKAGLLLVCTDSGTHQIDVDSSSLSLRGKITAKMPYLRSRDIGSLVSRIDRVTLSKSFSVGTAVSSADSRRISDAVLGAWRDIDVKARTRGAFHQPVIAFLRFLDADGRTLFSTTPRVFSHPKGLDMPKSIDFTVMPDGATAAVSVEAPAWDIELVFPGEGTMLGVDQVEVCLSPPLHCVDLAQACSVAPRQRADDSFDLQAAPAISRLAAMDLIPAYVAAAGSISIACARVRQYREQKVLRVGSRALPDPSKAARIFEAALTTPCISASEAETLMAAPHTVHHGAGCAAGIDVVQILPSVELFEGFPVSYWGAEFIDASWRGYTKVYMADGSSRVATDQGLSDAPVSFGPVIGYPASDAVSMEICTAVAGRKPVRISVPLTPDPSGRMALFIDPSGKPFTLTEALDNYVIPAENKVLRPFPGHVVVARAAAPLSPFAAIPIHGIPPSHIMAAINPAQNLDFGRRRFFAFGPGGTTLLTLAASGRDISSTCLDTRPVSAACPAVVADGDIFVAAGADIIRIHRTSVSTFAIGADASALAFDSRRREIWALRSDGTRVYRLDHPGQYYTIGLTPDVSRCSNIGTRSLIADEAGALYSLGTDSLSLSIDVAYEYDDTSTPPIGPGRFTADFSGSVYEAEVDVFRRHHGRCADAPDFTLRIAPPAGRAAVGILSPVIRRAQLPMASSRRISLHATVLPSFRLHKLSLS